MVQDYLFPLACLVVYVQGGRGTFFLGCLLGGPVCGRSRYKISLACKVQFELVQLGGFPDDKKSEFMGSTGSTGSVRTSVLVRTACVQRTP